MQPWRYLRHPSHTFQVSQRALPHTRAPLAPLSHHAGEDEPAAPKNRTNREQTGDRPGATVRVPFSNELLLFEYNCIIAVSRGVGQGEYYVTTINDSS